VTREEAMHGADAHRHTALIQSCLDLHQGDVPLLREQFLDKVTMRLDPARVAVAPARPSNCPTMLKSKASPADCARNADIKVSRSHSTTHAAINRCNDPIPKVL